jgi:putative spermidine/putrescine transport system permease protein
MILLPPGLRALRLGLRGLVLLILGFLLLPSVVVIMAAFSDRAILTFPPTGFSWRWFGKALAYEDFQLGFQNGLIVMAWASSIALAAGAAGAIAIHRFAFHGRRLLEALLLSPLVIPHFTLGLGCLILAAQLDIRRGYAIVVFTHVLLVLPFVLRSVYVSLRNLDDRPEQAAMSLGAPPGRVLWTVTLPLLVPGLAGGWLFAAILSFNEFTASLFVTSQSTQTLPVAMYNYVREYADPTMAALAALYIAATALVLTLANSVLGLGRILGVEHGR